MATNLVRSIQLIRAVLPHLRAQGSGRIIQMSIYGGLVAFPGNALYHATRWGIEGFVEAVAQEVGPFGIGMPGSDRSPRGTLGGACRLHAGRIRIQLPAELSCVQRSSRS